MIDGDGAFDHLEAIPYLLVQRPLNEHRFEITDDSDLAISGRRGLGQRASREQMKPLEPAGLVIDERDTIEIDAAGVFARAEALDESVDRDVTHFDLAFCEEFFDVLVGESVSEVSADGEHRGLGREPVAGERGTMLWEWRVPAMAHRGTLAK